MTVKIPRLTLGSRAPFIEGVSQTGEKVDSHNLVGKPVVLFFYLNDGDARCAAEISGFRDLHAEFTKLGIHVVGVGPDPVESHRNLADKHAVPFPLLADTEAKLFVTFGSVHVEDVEGSQANVSALRRTFLIDANARIARIYSEIDPQTHAAQVLADARELLLREEPRDIISHAPVLIIPNALPREVCQRLIQVWETEGHEESGFMKQVEGKTVGMVDYSHKIRRDHFVPKPSETDALIKGFLVDRILPEMRKAYNYEVSRYEDFRIACYDAQRGGYFRPHRDNTTDGTAHRRFAMSLLLNEDYEGGYLRFPEYGPHRYKPGAGGAVIFSCSLLHEATDVTAGRRFVLLSFLYGEREAKMREEYNRRAGGDYRA